MAEVHGCPRPPSAKPSRGWQCVRCDQQLRTGRIPKLVKGHANSILLSCKVVINYVGYAVTFGIYTQVAEVAGNRNLRL